MKHGTDYSFRQGCRCNDCSSGHRNRIRARRWQRREERQLIGNRWVAINALEHGTRSTYNNWHCRCQPCTGANELEQKTYRSSADPNRKKRGK